MPMPGFASMKGVFAFRVRPLIALGIGLGVIFGCALLPEHAQAMPGSFTRLQSLPGGDQQSFPQAISADGSTIVGASSSELGNAEGTMWTISGEAQRLGDEICTVLESGISIRDK